jgi:hypothetical protein
MVIVPTGVIPAASRGSYEIRAFSHKHHLLREIT